MSGQEGTWKKEPGGKFSERMSGGEASDFSLLYVCLLSFPLKKDTIVAAAQCLNLNVAVVLSKHFFFVGNQNTTMVT